MRLWFLFVLVIPFVFPLTLSVESATAKTTTRMKKVKTGISWKISPPEVAIFLDGKRLGTAAKLKFTRTRPGKHIIRLTKGGDEEELEVKVAKGQILQLVYGFSE